MNLVHEHFDSIHQVLSTVDSRRNNNVMRTQNSSRSNDEGFTGSKSYEEAVELFQNGYTDILPQIKSGVARNVNAHIAEQRRKVRLGVVGYAPHVPNAIQNLPNSMIYTEQLPQKVKAISIVYNNTENCGTNKDEFVKSGIALLSAINILELSGIRVNLKIAFYFAEQNDDRGIATVNVKDYREHMDLQKLCFPVAHPSMFRRFGFKWLETVPGIKESGWAFGYGSQMRDGAPKGFLKENEYFINLAATRNTNYNPEELIKSLNIK